MVDRVKLRVSGKSDFVSIFYRLSEAFGSVQIVNLVDKMSV